MRQILKYEISRKAEHLHREPLEVPCGVKRIYIDADLPEEFRYMSFLILEDPAGKIRLQKQLAWGEQHLGIGGGVEDTSIGGVPGEIKAGTWKVGIGIFTEYLQQRLGEQEGWITLTVSDEDNTLSDPIKGISWTKEELVVSPAKYQWDKKYNRERRWFKGDFHTHTRLSDGKESTENAMRKAVDMEMDFYVPTEHNLMHTGWCHTSLCVLPGIEVTTDKGHLNLFGITRMPRRILDILSEEKQDAVEQYMEETIQEAEESGWLTSINHPFLTIWKWRYGNTPLEKINCMEIINDPTYQDAEPANEAALAFIDALWQDGHKVCGVGGSDSHNLLEERYEGAELPSIPGDPATWVWCDELTPRHLLDAVRKRHVCVTRFCSVDVSIQAEGRNFLPGDELPEEAKQARLSIRIRGYSEKVKVYVVCNGKFAKLQAVQTGTCVYEAETDLKLEQGSWQWARLEVRGSRGEFLAYTNPVYRGCKKPTCRTFREIQKITGEKIKI